MSDYVLSYPVDSGSGDSYPATTTNSETLVDHQLGSAAAMRQQMDHVAAMGSRAIAQQMATNALVAELIDRLKQVMDAEHDL